jgi:RNA polymerase sigma-70 factor (ECF subfamily)
MERFLDQKFKERFFCPKDVQQDSIGYKAMEKPSPEEFVFLLARHERLLGAYVSTLVPHPMDADDVLQEAKLVMWRAFGQFQAGTNFAAWSRKIAFHQVLAYRKKRKRDRLEFSEAFLNAVAEEMEVSGAELEERERVLHGCMAKLPAEQREVLRLRYLEGLELDAMAEQLGRSKIALYRQLSRVRHLLHGCVSRVLKEQETGFGDVEYVG